MKTALCSDDDIRAAGARAVAGWRLTARQVDQVVVLLGSAQPAPPARKAA